ncbi:hypothetical protein F511_45410 [Dorcoceras hygrometricum]|uniref:Uncharacterized protein n=1 Tax=Dorcoceras hygrometricum TaxID=472368 RepID=A0A2Z7A3A3_9LAMI|nr:hypothetical protein F511_45410 [Dorcoceras hygrometricum]
MARWWSPRTAAASAGRAPLVAGRCDAAGMLSCDDRLMCAATGRALVARGGRTSLLEWATLGAAWSTPVARSLRNVARAAAARFVVAAPPAGRCSGDVVTTDFF